jgi:tripartite ATP-independent transporter DctM subunit
MSILIFLVVLFVAMTLGAPIAFALMLTAIALMWHLDFFDAQLLAQNVLAGIDSFPLLAVPFFVLAGELMNAGGLSRRIIDLAQAFFGHIRGGLGLVAIGAAIMLASMSGSAIADTAALATLLLPMMRRQNYPEGPSAGLIAAGGIIAPIIPPSMPMVIYGVTTGTSITKLFLGGIVPGVLMGIALIFAWRWVQRGQDFAVAPRQPWSARVKVLGSCVWALMLPVIIVGGLRGGIFTPTEAAVVAAVYALFVATVVYRELDFKRLYHVLVAASRTTAVVMFLCGAATASAYMITLADLPSELADSLAPVMSDPRLFMVAVVVFLLLFRHGHGPDARDPDPRPGARAAGGQGRCRPGVFRCRVHPDRFDRADHAAGGHRAQRGLRRGPPAHGDGGHRRSSLPHHLPDPARPADRLPGHRHRAACLDVLSHPRHPPCLETTP